MKATLRSMWDTRPYRQPRSQGGSALFAGVCEGMGIRYQVDPTILRILFVCFGFFFHGILIYLVCWLLMPRFSLPLSPAEAMFSKQDDPRLKKERRTGFKLSIIIAILVTIVGSADPIGLLLLTTTSSLAVWWLLHAKQPEPPVFASIQMPPATDTMQKTEKNPFTMPTPPAWDPLGTAPFAWDLPDPPPAPKQPVKPKSQRAWAWLIIAGVIIIPSVLLGIATHVNEQQFARTVGETNIQVTDPEYLQPNYSHGIGELHLDFSDLTPLPEDKEVNITAGVGVVHVELPRHVPVALKCDAGIGETQCESGMLNESAEGGTLKLNIYTDIGTVEVE